MDAPSRTTITRSVCLMPRADRVLLNDFQDDSMDKTASFTVGIVGATGAVGQELLRLLERRRFPVSALRPFASARSAGKTVRFEGRDVVVEEAKPGVFAQVDVAFFAAGGSVSRALAPDAVKAGCLVIDKSSAFRLDPDIPLVIPEINPEALRQHKGIIANPNCSTAQLVVALKPLHDRAKIKRVVVATYQSVSGAGKEAMDELFSQTKAVFQIDEIVPKKFPKRIAFNLIPQIDTFMEDGYTREEWKMVVEIKKILDPKIKLTATCVRVPVFIGHSEAVNIEFENPITVDEAREVLRNAPGCIVIDKHEPGGYVTPYESVGEDATYISRIREDATVENGLAMWVVSDNLRKGAALNAIQIAECLINRKLITAKQKAA